MEEFPLFMQGIEEVRQQGDKGLFWRANVGGKIKEWEVPRPYRREEAARPAAGEAKSKKSRLLPGAQFQQVYQERISVKRYKANHIELSKMSRWMKAVRPPEGRKQSDSGTEKEKP